MIKAVV